MLEQQPEKQLYLPAREPDLEALGDDNHMQPQGLFFHSRFSEQSHIFTLFPSSECKQVPGPRPWSPSPAAVSWCLQSSKVQLQQLSKKATPKPFLLPQTPSLPTAQRKHPKHFARGFMAVLLFLNQGGKDLKVFINKGSMKTRLFKHSAAQRIVLVSGKATETEGVWEHPSLPQASAQP